jgi:hypothetical protein
MAHVDGSLSIEEQDAARLQRAFESYVNGATPLPAELAQAPLLEKWRLAILHINAEPLRMVPVLVGSVTGHPQHVDSRTIRTSQLIFLDRNLQWARTWNRVYRLGERAHDEIDSGSEVGA